MGKAAREKAEDVVFGIFSGAPHQDQSAQSHPVSLLPAPSHLVWESSLLLSSPYPPLISAFVCLTPAHRGAVSPPEVGIGVSSSAAAC